MSLCIIQFVLHCNHGKKVIYIRTSPLLSRVPVNMLLGAVLWPCAAVAPILLADRRSRSIPPASGNPATNPPHAAAVVNRRNRQTDGRTPNHYVDSALHTTRAVIIKHCVLVKVATDRSRDALR